MFGSILDRSLNITIVPLPPKCPELNLQENVWLTVCSLPTDSRIPLQRHCALANPAATG
jgi:transposase